MITTFLHLHMDDRQGCNHPGPHTLPSCTVCVLVVGARGWTYPIIFLEGSNGTDNKSLPQFVYKSHGLAFQNMPENGSKESM
jgi:hypothetical protein